MASSMLTGERRWASTRKSGMTVLGKVPKPINLPSQRLENHGLDPNVEIVPKGTLSWGSRSSLAAPNAWGSSNLSSPSTDGGGGSPSHLNGRPSSGGGTRPSTAGSDRSHEPNSNAWGPNSRPSTASGILASNQIAAAATRPRSAETRPGSSQLSRFAENSVDSTVAWGTAGTAERLGAASSKANSFNLSSGDFPTLGSEKNSDSHVQRGHSSQGRPASASSTASTQQETSESQLSVPGNRISDHLGHGNVDSWKAENYPYAGHGSPSNQHGQPYPSAHMPPHQFDSWHNPPFHPSDGWYRGGPTGDPYRPPGPPGSYPIEPYYHHGPPRPLPNPQALLRPEASPGGFLLKNDEPYRPHPRMPAEPYMVHSHSAMPVRPGIYPVPMPYDGYCGRPPASFSSSSEREVPIMGIASRPGVYNQYPTQSAPRSGGYNQVMTKEPMRLDQAPETPGQYRVLLKQHDGWEDHDAREKREQSVMPIPPLLGGNQAGVSKREGDWQINSRKQESVVSGSQPACDSETHSSDIVDRNLLDDSSMAADNSPMRKQETATAQVHDQQHYHVIKKNAILMEKVEGLNTKARTTDGLSEVGVSSSKGKTKIFKDVSINGGHFTKGVCASAVSTGNVSASSMGKPLPDELVAFTEGKNQESTGSENISSGPSELEAPVVGKSSSVETGVYAHDQKRICGVKGVDHRANLRSSKRDNDEWMKKYPGSDSSVNTSVGNSESGPGVCVLECHASQEALEKQELHHAAYNVGGTHTTSLDSVNNKTQRAKIRETAIQRAKQLQKEEEERTREQKAKALAKLEELNNRTVAGSSCLKSNHALPPIQDVLNEAESGAGEAPKADATFMETPSCTLHCDSEAAKHVNSDDTKKIGPSTDSCINVAAQSSAIQASAMPEDQKTNSTGITEKTTSGTHDNTASKQKQIGYRRRQSVPHEKNLADKTTAAESMGNKRYVGEVAVNPPSNDTLLNNEDPSVQHRKKNNRSAKNKNKLDEGLSGSSLPSSARTESSSEKTHTESGNTELSSSVAESILVPAESSDGTMGTQGPSNQGSGESTEETQGKASNHWRPHPHRKPTRNQQASKPIAKYHGTEAVIWAPVRPPSKNEPSEEVSQNRAGEATNPSGKSGNDVQNGVKAKRAEMERYIPKPVAKELSQLGNSHLSPSFNQAAEGDITGKPESSSSSVESSRLDGSTVGKTALASDSRNGEYSKHNKNGRTHASWVQRSSAESPSFSQSSFEGSISSNTSKTVQEVSVQILPSKMENLPKEQLTYTDDDWNDNSGNMLSSESVTLAPAGAKNYQVSRQKRQPYKAHRVAGSNYVPADNKDLQRGTADKTETQPPAVGLNELDGRKASRTENQNAGEHMRSQWQPKSPAYAHYGRQGNRGSRGQRVDSLSDKSGNEYPSPVTENNLMKNDSLSQTFGAEARHARHQEAERERKPILDPSKEQNHSLNQDMPSTFGLGPASVDADQEQPVSVGVRRQGQYNSRFQRGQDAGKQNLHMNGEKQKNSSHLEYQRIGSYQKPSDSFQQNPSGDEEAREGLPAHGSRYRERGRHHPRSGGSHFYGRSSAAARAGDS